MLTFNEAKIRINDRLSDLKNLGVSSIFIFGSLARGDQSEVSDVDILIEFAESSSPTMIEFIKAENILEDTLGCKVDLVTKHALHPQLKQTILEEAVRVA